LKGLRDLTCANVVSVRGESHQCPNVMWVTLPVLPLASRGIASTEGLTGGGQIRNAVLHPAAVQNHKPALGGRFGSAGQASLPETHGCSPELAPISQSGDAADGI